MTQEELLGLRKKILGEVMPLTMESIGNPSDRFSLLIRIIQSGEADGGLYGRAYDAARSIEDNELKINALMMLLDEVDFEIQSFDSGGVVAADSEGVDSEAADSANPVE